MAGLQYISSRLFPLYDKRLGRCAPLVDRPQRAFVLLALIWAALTVPAAAADYPRSRGPEQDRSAG